MFTAHIQIIMPNPPKKIKAVDLSKYKEQGYKFKAPGTNGAEFYELPGTTFTAKGGSKQDADRNRQFLIEQLQKGVSPEELVNKGHATTQGIAELSSYYAPNVVYTEPEPTVKTPISLQRGLVIDRKDVSGQNTDYKTYQYPDPNAGYSKSTTKYFFGDRPIDPSKSYDASGKFIPSYIDGETLNTGANLGTKKINVPTQSTLPLGLTETDETGKAVKSGAQKVLGTGNIGFKKGGLIEKIKLNYSGDNGTTIPVESGGIIEQYKKGGKIIKGYSMGGKTTLSSDDVSSIGKVAGAGGDLLGKPFLNNRTTDEYGRINTGSKGGDYAASFYGKGLPAAAQGAAMGAAFGPVGLAIGTGLGFTAGGIQGLVQAKQDRQSIADQKKAEEDAKLAELAQIQQGIAAEKRNQANEERQSYLGGANYKKGGLIKKFNSGGLITDQRVLDEPNNYDTYNQEQASLPKWARGLGNQDNISGEGFGNQTPMFSKGGKIVGKGTGTSDSITAKMKAGSFIVPAKNADVAKEVAKKVLKVPTVKKKANLNQEGGETIKVSNGEYHFSPEETQEIKAQLGEEFLEMLAPDAEHGSDEMKNGGLTAAKARIILHDGKIRGKSITEQQRKYFGAISNGMKCGGMVMEMAKGGKVPKTQPSKLETKQMTLPVRDINEVELRTTPTGMAKETVTATVPKKGLGISGSQLTGLLSEGSSLINGIRGQNFSRNQIAKANEFLAASGKRPVGIIDSGFQNALNKATAESKYGLSAPELAALNNENVGLRNREIDQAQNLSGGSAANAYAMTRGAINDSFGRGLKTTIANRQAQLAKQANANNLIAQKADMNRQLFEDTLSAWNTNQQSGATLLGAGLDNKFGSMRYNEALRQLALNRANENNSLNGI